MSKIDQHGRSAGGRDDGPHRGGVRQRLASLRAALQDRLWAADEQWAADRGFHTRRSPSGWRITVCNPRSDRDRVTDDECPGYDGAGAVVADPPERGDGS